MRFTSWFHWIHGTINTTNLAGAVDVVVIRHLDGTYRASPFYVRFGKLGVIQSEGKDVYIHVNGVLVDLHMILSDEGQAYFENHDSETLNRHESCIADCNTDNLNCNITVQQSSYCSSKEHGSELISTSTHLNSLKDGYPWSNLRKNNRHRQLRQFTNKFVINQTRIHRNQYRRRSLSKDYNSYSDDESTSLKFSLIRDKSSSPIHHEISGDEFDLHISTDRPYQQRIRTVSQSSQIYTSNTIEESNYLLLNKCVTELPNIYPENGTKNLTDGCLSRCVSDGDLDKSNDLNHATFFLAAGRKAVSEIQLIDENDSNDDNGNFLVNKKEFSYDSMPYAFVLSKHTGETEQLYPDEAPIFNISNLTEAVWYIKLLEHDVSRLNFDWDNEVIEDFIQQCSSKSSLENMTSWKLNLTNEESITKSDNEYEYISKGSSKASNSNGNNKSSVAQSYTMRKIFKPLLGSSQQPEEDNGVYLNDVLNKVSNDPELTSIYFNRLCDTVDDEQESGRGASLTSPSSIMDSVSAILGDVALSDCGGLATTELTSELFEKHLITDEAFLENPDIIHSPNFVVRINYRYYNWQTAAPMLLSASLFHQKLSQSKIDKLIEQHMPSKVIEEKPASSGWWIFGRGWTDQTSSAQPNSNIHFAEKSTTIITANSKESNDLVLQNKVASSRRIHLTSNELESLNFKYGENEVTFSVTTPLQGTSVVTASVFLFHETDKFIISDIDGTITRSDVIGHILPLVGKDWSHDGIAEFFCAIADNGYNFIYVSSRSIGQSALTKDYLRNLRQRGFELPRGPALLSPDSLFNALYREVVTKKPEEFKIDCLKTIANLFAQNSFPFYAGFGNRVNDQWAYTAVGIPLQRIFTINPSGVVKHHASDTSSYKTLHEIVDQLFPPVFKGGALASLHGPQEYSTFTYWRDEL